MLERYLHKRLKTASITALVGETLRHNRSVDSTRVKVACVQKQINLVSRVEHFIYHIEGFVKQAAEEDCALIAFPEYVFFDLFGLLPGFSSLNRYLNNKAKTGTTAATSVNHSSPLYKLFAATARPIQRAVEQIMCALARKYAITIYSGCYLVKEHDGLYNGGALISAEGIILGRQKKLHLTDFEVALGLKRDDRLHVFSTDFGGVACPVCMDASYFETFHVASALGADVVIIPIANNEAYHLHRALRGIWPRVQEAYVFGLKASLNGWIGGMPFTGKAGVFAPWEMTDNRDGVIAVAKHYEGDALVTGILDLGKLEDVRNNAEYYGDRNLDFEASYYTNTYKERMF